MKKSIKMFGIVALATAIGLSMAGCPTSTGESTNGNNGGGNPYLGPKLELSGQVYTETGNIENYTITYSPYTGNMTFNDYEFGTVTITGGKLSFEIETPPFLYTMDDYLSSSDSSDYDDVTVNNMGVKWEILNHLYDSDAGYDLIKENRALNKGTTSFTHTREWVEYMYVDGDVTISGKGKTVIIDGVPCTTKTNNFSLALKAGWNVVYYKGSLTYTYPDGLPSNPYSATPSSATQTLTSSLSNPSSPKWVLFDFNH